MTHLLKHHIVNKSVASDLSQIISRRLYFEEQDETDLIIKQEQQIENIKKKTIHHLE